MVQGHEFESANYQPRDAMASYPALQASLASDEGGNVKATLKVQTSGKSLAELRLRPTDRLEKLRCKRKMVLDLP